jgi:hypothetical protein
MEILDKKYRRFFDSAFEMLLEMDFSKLSKELTKRIIAQINFVLDQEDKKRDYPHIERLLISMRKGQDNFNTEIDEITEKFYPEFYKQDYNLEVFPEKRDSHIQRYIDSIKVRNKIQGKNGIFSGFVDRPYYTIRRIVELEKPSLTEEMINDLLETIFNTLCLETQTYAEKIDSIELMMALKRQPLSYTYNWDNYYSKLEQHFSEMEKGHSGFFMKDETLSLKLHLIFIKIIFNIDCLPELLEILALINSGEEYEVISSLVALKDFLSFEASSLIGEPVMPILVQSNPPSASWTNSSGNQDRTRASRSCDTKATATAARPAKPLICGSDLGSTIRSSPLARRRASSSAMTIVRAPRTFTSLMPLMMSGTCVAIRHKDDREALAHRGERSVFELGREHPFAVGVRDLFQLQRAFERDGVGRSVAETVQVVPFVDVFCDRFDLRRDHLKRLVHQFGEIHFLHRWSSPIRDRHRDQQFPPRHLIRQIQERHDLVGKCLRGGHADLVAAAQG